MQKKSVEFFANSISGNVIGLTSLEIEEKYGDFTLYSQKQNKGDEGLYRSANNGYIVKKETSSQWAVWFSVKFDENGIAVEASEHIRLD